MQTVTLVTTAVPPSVLATATGDKTAGYFSQTFDVTRLRCSLCSDHVTSPDAAKGDDRIAAGRKSLDYRNRDVLVLTPSSPGLRQIRVNVDPHRLCGVVRSTAVIITPGIAGAARYQMANDNALAYQV